MDLLGTYDVIAQPSKRLLPSAKKRKRRAEAGEYKVMLEQLQATDRRRHKCSREEFAKRAPGRHKTAHERGFLRLHKPREKTSLGKVSLLLSATSHSAR